MTYELIVGDARALPLEDKSVDLVLGSPIYPGRRKYGRDDIDLDVVPWVQDLMIPATLEALRVSKGPVLWVCSGTVRNGNYQPGPEMLMAALFELGIELLRPPIWRKNGMPGSGGPQWLRNDYEVVVAVKNPGSLPYANPLAMGTELKYPQGGRMKNRGTDDRRCDVASPIPKLANPGNLIHVTVGGGHMGHELAHENEAPFPEGLAEFFIKRYCPPFGVVLDSFVGSGTSVAVARKLNRRGIGVDIREEAIALAERRVGDDRYRPVRLPRRRPPAFTFAEDP